MSTPLTIGALAKLAQVNIESIRFYQRRGLVEEPPRPLGGIRRYAQAHVRRIRFIKQAQLLGFSLDEVAECSRWRTANTVMTRSGLAPGSWRDVRERLAKLRSIERALAALVDQCHRNTGEVRCPLISSLDADTA